jgi:hypothetical protein
VEVVAQEEPTGQVLLFKERFEGQKVTDYRLAFGGKVELGDAELIEALKLGREVTLRVVGRVMTRNHTLKKEDGMPTSETVSSATVVIETVSLDES